MTQLAIIRGLTYTSSAQVLNRWLVPTYRSLFRWTGNRADAEDTTTWTLLNVADHLRLPELVEVVDGHVADAAVEAVRRHWRDRYGVSWSNVGEIAISDSTPTLDSLVQGLSAEMRLVLVLRFVRRRSPAAIATQLRIRPEAATSRTIVALGLVARRFGFPQGAGEPAQLDEVSMYVADLVAKRRPVRFGVSPPAWLAMLAAGHVQAAITGNDLPTRRFMRSLECKVEQMPL